MIFDGVLHAFDARMSISVRSMTKSIGLVRRVSVLLSSALRLVSALSWAVIMMIGTSGAYHFCLGQKFERRHAADGEMTRYNTPTAACPHQAGFLRTMHFSAGSIRTGIKQPSYAILIQ